MKFLVDHRERNMIKLVEDVCEEVEVTQLPIGDYVLLSDSEAIIVERKTVPDFLSSVRSNRLWDQLLRMMKRMTVSLNQVPMVSRLWKSWKRCTVAFLNRLPMMKMLHKMIRQLVVKMDYLELNVG